ncbi:SCAN domain-containing protein 3 [Trichonephila clavipes]|nr:SCAN domain-containing protein 3 [Trichonephila clavipes]
MSDDIETQLVEKLKSRHFSLQMDESTLRDSEVVLLVYARYIDKGEFSEEMEFYKSLATTTSTADIYYAECGFSAVNDLLSKKRNRLNITKRGNLRHKLTKLEPEIKSLVPDMTHQDLSNRYF